MHKVLLSMGSNTQARFNINRAKCILQKQFPTIRFTDDIESESHGNAFTSLFVNSLGYFESDLKKNELIAHFKDIEKNMGRDPKDKIEGKVIIDIDLIKWDNEVVKPEDFERSYIRDLLKSLKDYSI